MNKENANPWVTRIGAGLAGKLGSVALSTEGEEADAQESEDSGGWLGDGMADELDSIDRGPISGTREMDGDNIEDVCGEAIVADVVSLRAHLAIEVSVESADPIAGDEFGVEVGRGAGTGE